MSTMMVLMWWTAWAGLVSGKISDVLPDSYSLLFNIYPDTAQLTGSSDAKFELLKPTRQITLNCKDLQIIRVILTQEKTMRTIDVEFEYPNEQELALTRVDGKPFIRDNYIFRAQYRASLKRELNGIYLSGYKDESGGTHTIVATHFEPTHARTAFPCFDEPQLKARFTVTIDHEAKYKAVSNMPTKKSRLVRSELKRTEFISTPPMSTYLVAFVLSDLEEMTGYTHRGVPVSVHFRDVYRDMAKDGLHTVIQSVEFLEGYVGRVYPLPKLDVVALPEFGIGGMENWGLITLREEFFFTDNTTDPADLTRNRAVVAHEVAHMWFGDLVSISSWNDLWLKEGAANLLMVPAIRSLVLEDPLWTESDLQNTLMLFSRYPALNFDASLNTHPLLMNISDPFEAAGAFDAISYSKSSAVLNMLRSMMGDDKFQKGIIKYIKDYQYGTASLNDFLTAMDATGPVYRDFKVSELIKPWLTKSGHPLVEVTKLNDRKYRLKQSRFVNKPGLINWKLARTRWPIMVTLQTDKNEMHKFMMTSRTMIVSFNYSPSYVKINVNSTMFYRTGYDSKSLSDLTLLLDKDPDYYFTEEDRAGMISDILTLAMVNKTSISDAFRMIRYLPNESSYMVWNEAIQKLNKIFDNLSKNTQSLFKRFMSKLLSEAQELDLEGSISKDMLKKKLEYYGVVYGVPKAPQEAEAAYESWERGESQGVSPEVLMYAVQELDKGEEIWEKLQKTPHPGNEPLYQALASSKDSNMIKKLLQGSLEYDWVPLQKKYEILNAVSRYHPTEALNFFQEKYDVYYSWYGEAQFNFGNIIANVIGNLRTNEDLSNAVDFLSQQNLGTGKREYEMAVDELRGLLNWRKCCEEELTNYLNKNT